MIVRPFDPIHRPFPLEPRDRPVQTRDHTIRHRAIAGQVHVDPVKHQHRHDLPGAAVLLERRAADAQRRGPEVDAAQQQLARVGQIVGRRVDAEAAAAQVALAGIAVVGAD